MKKIILFLLLSIAGYGQIVPSGQEQDFDYGIRNTASQLDDNAVFLTVQDATGVQGKSTSSVWAKKIYVDNADAKKQFLSTGLLKNGLLQANVNTTLFDITAGTGIISNFDNPDAPTSNIIIFPSFTGILSPYLTTSNITYVAINSVPQVVMQASPFTDSQRRDLIILGAIVHSNLSTINTINNISAPANADTNQLHDLMEAIGALNISGNKYSANGANLSLNKSAGDIFKLGINFANNWKDPHKLTIDAQTLLTLRYRTQNGTEGSDVTVLNPAVYDLNNVLTSVPSNRFSIQTVTLFQSGITRVQYGQNTYATMAEAEAAINTRAYVVEPNIALNGIARAYIILKNSTTSLQNASDAKIVEAQKFGGSTSGGVALTNASIIAALGFTPENVANKSGTLTASSTLYPNNNAVIDYAVAKVVNTKSTTPITGGALNARMCVSNGILYVTEYTNNKIGVFSLENPMSPTKIYDFTVGAAPRHVVVSGRNLFVSCHDANRVEVWDIQNPESALKIGEIPTGSQPKMFVLLGNEIFVACAGTSKVEKYKITMPDTSLSNFSYYKVGEVSVGLAPLALSYNGDGLLAVCGNGDNVIKILSTDDLNVASSTAMGGAGHGTCAWFGKTQLLVTDWTTESLLSIDYNNLASPVLSSSITVSENPEQIEIVGNMAYIPSLRTGVSPSYLDFIDLSNAKLPVKIKSETLTVNAAGFTAPYTDGVNTYLYVDGHEAPFNIDAIKIQNGNFHRFENLMEDVKYINRLGVANLTTNTIDESKAYTNITNPYAISGIDNGLRTESGITTLPNPNSVRNGKLITISNPSNVGNVSVVNPFSGFSSLTLFPLESVTVQAVKNGATYKWDAISNRRNLPTIYDSGSNVGIGTITPSVYLNYRFVSINGADGAVLQLRKGDGTFAEIGGDGTFVNFDTFGGAYSKFSISGVEKFKIESSVITPSVPLFNVSLTGIPTAPTAAPGTNTTQIATMAALQVVARPYKVYTALLSQTGTNAPTAIVQENTLGGTVTWSRAGTGAYLATLSGAFTTSKTFIVATLNTPSATLNGAVLRGNLGSVNECLFQTETDSGQFDGAMQNASIEIRVYN